MALLRIKCSDCTGTVWEDEIPTSRNGQDLMDLVCLNCGRRWLYPIDKYKKWKEQQILRATAALQR